MSRWKPPELPGLHQLLTTPVVFACLAALLLLHAITSQGRFPTIQLRMVSQSLPLVIAALALLVLHSGRAVRLSRRAVALIAALSMVMLASFADAYSPDYAAPRARLYLFLLVTGALVYSLCAAKARMLLPPLLWMLGLLHLFLLAMFLMHLSMGGAQSGDPSMLVPHFTNVRHFTFMSFFAAAAGSALIMLQPRARWSAFALVACALFAILLLGSRGALLAWLIFLTALAALGGREAGRALLMSVLALGVGLLAAQAFRAFADPAVLAVLPGSLWERIAAGHIAVDSSRFRIWSATLQAIVERPWLGYGAEGFLTTRCCAHALAHPHNMVLQFGMEYGIAGLAVLAAGMHHLVWPALRSALADRYAGRVDPELVIITCLTLAFLAFAMVDGLLYFAVPLLVATLLAALLAGFTGAPSESGA